MANQIPSITPESRFALFSEALAEANRALKDHGVALRCAGQWPPRPEDRPDALAFDQRPDIDLSMHVNGRWVPIDLIYLRQMPIEPEKLKSVAVLTQDLFNKALGHLQAMKNPHVLISESGSKFDKSQLQKHFFDVDEKGYIRIDQMRVAHEKPGAEFLSLIKASDIRSHTIHKILEVTDEIVNITDDFDQIRTDGRVGMYCLIGKTQNIAAERFPLERRRDAEEYEGPYIPLVRQLS